MLQETNPSYQLVEAASDHPAVHRREPAPRPGLVFDVVSDLASLERDWRDFQTTADCTPFQTYEWLSAWQSCIGRRTSVRPAIVTARGRDGRLVLLLPLAIETQRLHRRLVFLGRALCDYNAPLLHPDFPRIFPRAEWDGLWRRIAAALRAAPAAAHDVIHLDKMPGEVGGQPNPLLALHTLPHENAAYSTRLEGDWTTFYTAKRSSATRRRDRTKRKRLEAHDAIRAIHAGDPVDRVATLEALFEQKQIAFARQGIRNLFAEPGYQDFFRQLVTRAAGLVHVGQLNAGSQVVAANLGLVFRDRYFHILASRTDGPLSRFGPGVIQLHEQMKYAIERRCRVFDFTIGDEAYKLDWADTAGVLHDHISAARLPGLPFAAALLVHSRARAFVKSSPRLLSLGKLARRALGRLRGQGRHDRPAPDAPGDAEAD